MTTAGFQKRLSVLIIAAATVLAVWVKTEPKKPEPRPVRLMTETKGVHNELPASEETGNAYDPDAERADLEGHKAYLDQDTVSTVPAIPDPQGQTDPEDVPTPASPDEPAGVTYELQAGEETPGQDGLESRTGGVERDHQSGLSVLDKVEEDMPADATAQDPAEMDAEGGSESEPQAGEKDPGKETATTPVVVPADDGTQSPESPTAAAETAGAGAPDPGMALYSVNGATLSPYLQEYLYGQLARYGAEWFFPVALCQIYQESRYLTNAQNPNGQDKGLCQFREQFWEYHARLSGLYEYDIWNPIDQLWVYSWLMAENLRKSGGDIGMALSRYYLGEAQYSEVYVQAVMQWINTMEVR